MQVFIYCKITLHVSGVHRTHHQEYIKLRRMFSICESGKCRKFSPYVHCLHEVLVTKFDLYQKLQLQFDVHLMMGWMDTRNM